MFRSKNLIGVDIGSHTVKVCQVHKVGDKYELENYGTAEIYKHGRSADDFTPGKQLKVDALKRALEDGNIKGHHAVSAVSGESIIVRYLQLPEMPEFELKKALQWEAEEYIPFRLSEVNLDSQILGHVNDGDHFKMELSIGGRSCQALWWNQGTVAGQVRAGQSVAVAFALEEDTFTGGGAVQLVVKDMYLEE